MKIVKTLAAAAAVIVISAPAAAQTADVRVRVDTQAIREAMEEVRTVMQDLGLRSLSRDIADTVREVTREVSRELSRELSHIDFDRDFGREFGRAWGAWAEAGAQRNFTARDTDRETRTFAVGANGEFTLENLSGDVRVQAGSGRDVTVEIIRNARGRTDADVRAGLARVRVETVHRGDRVNARTIYPNERQSSYSVSVDFVVTVPTGTRVTAGTMSGDMSVTGVHGDVSVSSMSGDVTVADAPRLVHAKTASGDVTLRAVGADNTLAASTMSGDVVATGVKARRVDMSSVSGSVTIRDASASDVKISSTSGDLIYEGSVVANGRYTLVSHSGDAQLLVDGRVGFTFEGTTYSGTVRSDLPLQVNQLGSSGRRANRNVRGTFGDGSASITATSFSGDIIVTKK